jgi:hypothetical protein
MSPRTIIVSIFPSKHQRKPNPRSITKQPFPISHSQLAPAASHPELAEAQPGNGLSFKQSRTLYEWKHRSSIIIFVLVILLVLSGIYFAALQFHYGLGAKAGKAQTTEIDASLKGIKAKSSVLGVVVLAISMAFFYLYLVNVYPIVGSPKELTTPSTKVQ